MDRARLFKLLGSAFALFVLVVAGAGVQQSIYSRIATQRVEAIAASAASEAKVRCRRLTVDPACLATIKREARAEQREEYDLYSQRVMALWSAVMGLMAIVGACLSGIGVYLVWRTWDATREAAESSRKTLRSYIARERAILITGWATDSLEENSPHPVGFSVKITNSGLSIGRIYLIEWMLSPEPIWPERMPLQIFDDIVVLPGEAHWTDHLWWENPHREDTDFWLMGSVHYKTLENELFTSHFSYNLKYDAPRPYVHAHWHPDECIVVGRPRDS